MAVTVPVGSSSAKTTYNIDVCSIVRRWNRIIMELNKSQSSGISQMMPFDITRLVSYLGAMTQFQAFIVSQPLLDCPETGPTEMPLPSDPVVAETENESVFDAIQLAIIARDEMKNSQSARIPTNLVKFDYERQQNYLAKLTNLVAYIQAAEPLDLPETSPSMAVTGPGNMGV